MAIVPVEFVNNMRTFLTELLLNHRTSFKTEDFPDGPRLQESRPPPTSNNVSVITQDPFGDLATNASVTELIHSVPTNVSFQQQHEQTLSKMPIPGPLRTNIWNQLPLKVRLPPGHRAPPPPDTASLGENSWSSQLSKLTEDNSRLMHAIKDKDVELESITEDLTSKIDALTQNRVQDITAAVQQAQKETNQQMLTLQGKLVQLTQSLTQAHGDIHKTKSEYIKLKTHSDETIKDLLVQSQTTLEIHKRDLATLQEHHLQTLAQDRIAQATALDAKLALATQTQQLEFQKMLEDFKHTSRPQASPPRTITKRQRAARTPPPDTPRSSSPMDSDASPTAEDKMMTMQTEEASAVTAAAHATEMLEFDDVEFVTPPPLLSDAETTQKMHELQLHEHKEYDQQA